MDDLKTWNHLRHLGLDPRAVGVRLLRRLRLRKLHARTSAVAGGLGVEFYGKGPDNEVLATNVWLALIHGAARADDPEQFQPQGDTEQQQVKAAVVWIVQAAEWWFLDQLRSERRAAERGELTPDAADCADVQLGGVGLPDPAGWESLGQFNRSPEPAPDAVLTLHEQEMREIEARVMATAADADGVYWQPPPPPVPEPTAEEWMDQQWESLNRASWRWRDAQEQRLIVGRVFDSAILAGVATERQGWRCGPVLSFMRRLDQQAKRLCILGLDAEEIGEWLRVARQGEPAELAWLREHHRLRELVKGLREQCRRVLARLREHVAEEWTGDDRKAAEQALALSEAWVSRVPPAQRDFESACAETGDDHE